MIEKIKNLVNKRYFHVCMTILIIVVILFIVGMLILRYNVEGETNMPFNLTKITVISSSEGIDKDAGENKWAFDIYQNNDIYIYIDKNENYKETEAIKNIVIDNFTIEGQMKDNIKIYKPEFEEENVIFKYSEKNKVDRLEYIGELINDIKTMQVSNQGGIIAFRCSNDNLTEYRSDEDTINHNELLKKANITNESLKFNLKFDLSIILEDGKEFKTNVELDLPVDDVVNNGVTSKEFTDMSKFVFKRIKN